MRTNSAARAAALGLEDYDVVGRLKVANADGTMVDYSAWIIRGVGAEDVDSICEQATFTLAREDGALSLAPTMESSSLNVDDAGAFAPALQLVRAITFETAVVPPGRVVGESDYVEEFTGNVDKIAWPDDTNQIVLTCRDKGGVLSDWQIKTERTYDAETGLATLIGSLLSDNDSSETLYVPLATAAGLAADYKQAKGSLLKAIRELAEKSGSVAKYRYDASDDSRLTLYEPDRTSPTVAATFGATEYAGIRQLSIAIYEVRTEVDVVYTDLTTGVRTTVTSTADASITDDFGDYRWMGIEEGSDSVVRTDAQATAFALSVRLDVQEPFASQEVELYWAPHIQLGDYLTFSPNGVHYDSDQSGAVVERRWEYSQTKHRHWIKIRGKPAGAYRRHLLRSRGTVNPATPIVEPRPSQSGSTGTLVLAITDPAVRLNEVFFKAVTAAGDHSFDETPSTANGWTQDAAAPYSLSAALQELHNTIIAWGVSYYDDDGLLRWFRGSHTFDLDLIAKVQSLSVAVTSAGLPVVSAGGDEDTTGIFVKASATAYDETAPSTAGTPDIDARSGHVALDSPTLDAGDTVYVTAWGYNSATGALGPMMRATGIRGPSGPAGATGDTGAAGADGADGTDGAAGLNNAVVYIYQRAASAPSLPSASATYTFATKAITGLNNGWTATIPAADGNPLYVSAATASSTSTSDVIAAAEWATAVILAQDGTDGAAGDAGADGDPGSDGADGLNAATVYLFRRASSSPAVPNNSVTYTFATGALTGSLDSWSQTVPAHDGNPLYVTTATALSASTTDSIAAGEWATPQILAQDGAAGSDGVDGTNGADGDQGPAGPTGSFNTSVIFGAIDNDTVEWAAGSVKLVDGTTYSIVVGTTGNRAGRVWIYLDPAASTTVLQVSGTYSDAAGVGKYILCYMEPIADTDQLAMCIPTIGLAGLNSDNLQVNSVLAEHIAAGQVDAGHISAISLAVMQAVISSLSVLSANIGQVTAGYLRNVADTYGIALGNVQAQAYWTRYISFHDSDYFIKHEDFTLDHSGNAVFAGSLSAASGSVVDLTDETQKSIRISHLGFRPMTSGGAFTSTVDKTTHAGGVGTAALEMGTTLLLPIGCEITSVSIRGACGNVANDVDVTVYRQAGTAAATPLRNVQNFTAAENTVTLAATDVTDVDESYPIVVTMDHDAGTAPYFNWVQIDYTSHGYRETV